MRKTTHLSDEPVFDFNKEEAQASLVEDVAEGVGIE